jgi:cytochrome c
MPRASAVVLPLLALAGLSIAACSKSGQGSAAPAAPASPPTGSFGTAVEPGAGKLKLDIEVNGHQPVYGDPVAGKAVFSRCVSCHAVEAGENRVGPSLHGLTGRHSGSVADFHYSAANKASGLVWTEQELYAYLENPQKVVPGTYMTYTGVKDPQQRADVIAYLQESTK